MCGRQDLCSNRETIQMGNTMISNKYCGITTGCLSGIAEIAYIYKLSLSEGLSFFKIKRGTTFFGWLHMKRKQISFLRKKWSKYSQNHLLSIPLHQTSYSDDVFDFIQKPFCTTIQCMKTSQHTFIKRSQTLLRENSDWNGYS